MKVRIEDMYDGFAITVSKDDGTHVYVSIDQEDDRRDLKKVFEALGIEVEYEEVY